MVGERIKALAESMRDEVTELRHHFHRHPETAWKEVETSDNIEALLKEWGFENIRRGFRGTRSGVVADLNAGGLHSLRADMDASPLRKRTCALRLGPRRRDVARTTPIWLFYSGPARSSFHEGRAARVGRLIAPASRGRIHQRELPRAEHLVREGVLEGIDASGSMSGHPRDGPRGCPAGPR